MENNNKLNINFDHLNYTNNYHTWTNQISNDNRNKEWIISHVPNHNIVWGKILNKNLQNTNLKEITLSHYTIDATSNHSTKLIPC